MSNREQCAFIGLGGMGACMAANLSAWLESEGFPKLIVWNRTSSKADKFASENPAVVAQSLEEVAEKCDVVIASLANDTAADAVYTKLFEAKKGAAKRSVFIETSTLYPDFVVTLQEKAKQSSGSLFVCAPVFGPPPMAKSAQLTVVLAGDEEGRKIAERFCVPSIGKGTIDVGSDVKRAASLKLCGNSLVAGVIEILAESMTLADKCGVGSDLLCEFVEKFMPAPSMIGYSKKILNDKFDSAIGFPLTGGMKDVSHIRALAAQHGATMPTMDQAFRNMTTAKAVGHDQLDWSSLAAGPRLAAGLEPFGKSKKLEKGVTPPS